MKPGARDGVGLPIPGGAARRSEMISPTIPGRSRSSVSSFLAPRTLMPCIFWPDPTLRGDFVGRVLGPPVRRLRAGNDEYGAMG
jgi:hypothetical protein